jgi:NurA domain
MPYQGEYAHYQPLKRIVESERVQQLLRRSRILERSVLVQEVVPQPAPAPSTPLPSLIVAVDGSYAEVAVRNGYPGAKVGYLSVASVLMNLAEVERLDTSRPVNPIDFRKTEEPSSEAMALPGCNVITRDHVSACDSFREAIFEWIHEAIVDEEDLTRLLATYQVLLAYKPTDTIACPYTHLDCKAEVQIGQNVGTCPCSYRKPLYPTDAMRIHERFTNDSGTNGEAFGYVMQVWERLLLVHLLRCFEQRQWLGRLGDVAFFIDGPLAVFGPPAWLSASTSKELKRINKKVRAETGNDMMIVGIEKSGNFVSHFEELDRREDGAPHFSPATYFLPTDDYIKKRIIYSDSSKRYGMDTYFGRKFFYKTRSGARIVANIALLTDEQDTLDTDQPLAFPQFGTVCALLDKLATSQFENALAPLVSAHAQAAIPLHLGQKVLKQLAQALMRDRES